MNARWQTLLLFMAIGLLIAPGCRSRRKAAPSDGNDDIREAIRKADEAAGVGVPQEAAVSSKRRKKRDYYSVNRASWEFLKDSVRRSRVERRQNWRETMDWGPRIRENLKLGRSERRFTYQTIWQDEMLNARETWEGIKRELKNGDADIGEEMRFGLLDSGD